MSKLYTVQVTYDYVIVADDIANAYGVAAGYAQDALSDMDRDDLDINITPGVSAYKWDDDCVPYNGDGNKRTSDYKKEST